LAGGCGGGFVGWCDYYNDNDPFAAQWLRNLIEAGLLPPGDVDERSILDVRGDDLRGYRRCHFFAGIGGWPHALDLAGWGEEEVWTGSCPCQPLSVAGQGRGHADERHLWPAFYRLVSERCPAVLFGEQVASKDGREWFAGVRADLEAGGYAVGAAIMPACSVGAPHRRDRLWFVADADGGDAVDQRIQCGGWDGLQPDGGSDSWGSGDGERAEGAVVDAAGERRREGRSEHDVQERRDVAASFPRLSNGGFWDDAEWLVGADGKARRVKPGLRLLAHGLPARVGRLRGYGNAIVPQVAAKFISAYLDG
jgi:DNA (cytosine-5)-methyltransferase 1